MKIEDFKNEMVVFGVRDWFDYYKYVIGKVIYIKEYESKAKSIYIIRNTKIDINIKNLKDLSDFEKSSGEEIIEESGKFFKKYSKKDEEKYKNLISILSKQDFLNIHSIINKYFNKEMNIFLLKIRIIFKKIFMWLNITCNNIFIGTLDLIFGDLFKFYRNRKQILILRKKIKKIEQRTFFVLNRGIVVDDSKELRIKLKKLEKEKNEFSRTFIALLVAVISLIISIVN
ncbi:hypothetical protein [Marispirochaeta sp.]|uniref:hypothetical protein n=1 Tax=Marispirochaeta sp. TaxID=2038653 RepID=UPI0029C91FD1|nr:hypothetical protein [Marispirochaeta sp.]